MQIALISDTHFGMKRLGFHSSGVNLIEQDNYDAIRYASECIKISNPDIILHGGDIFEDDNPSSNALVEYFNFCEMVGENGHGVAGNHDNRKLLEILDSVTKMNTYYEWGFKEVTQDGWSFFFLPHLDPVIKNGKREYKAEYELFAEIEKRAKGKKAILITHGILKSEAEAFNVNLQSYNGSNVIPDRMLKEFEYCIIGHNHTPSIRNINGCKVIVPGSTVPDLFKTGLHHGLGVLFLDPDTGEMERKSFIPRDIKKLDYTGAEEFNIQEGGIYSITDSSKDGLSFEYLQEMRNIALLITVERESPDHIKLSNPGDKLPSLVEYSKKWEEEHPGISESIQLDLTL